MENILVDFKCVPERLVYNSADFKIYGCSVNLCEHPNIKITKYGTCTIKGNLPELNLGCDYMVKAKEVSDARGIGYDVINIKREKPTSLESTRAFLYEILTYNQTNTLLEVYPDIVDRIMNNRLDDIDLNKTKGIKEYTFNVIKNKVIENFKLAEIVEEFKGLFRLSTVKKLYEKYTSVDKIKEVIREEPYKCLCKLGGIGFKTADTLLLSLDKDSKQSQKEGKKPILFFNFDLTTSYQRAKACVDYLLLKNEEDGNTYMNIGTLKKEFDILVPEAKGNLPIILKDDNDVVFNRELMLVCKKETYETEKYIADIILNKALQNNTKWDCDYTKFQELDGFKLTENQCKTSEYMCNNNIVLLVGYGGSGKSSSTKAFVDMLNSYKKSHLLLAPTGRASKVLSGFTKEKAMTIHRGLNYMPPNNWDFNEENKLPHDVIIVDEFSMVDVFLFRRLLEAIDFTRTKLLLIGDDAQIPSVGAGNVLYDLLKSNIIPTVKLDKVFRYGKGGLSTVATDTRMCEEYLDKKNTGMQIFGEDQSYIFMPITQDKIVDYAVNMYSTLLNKGYNVEDIAVLSCYTVGDYGTVNINKKIQNAVNKAKDKIVFGDTEFRLNDIVMNCVNDYKAIIYDKNSLNMGNTTFIANGESGIVVEILHNAIVVDYDGTLIYCPKSSMKNIKLAYAISTHKSQGGQFKIVILITPRSHTYMLNSNLLYVGESRAKERCYHLGEIKTVNTAIKKKENFDRKTMLGVFLKETK